MGFRRSPRARWVVPCALMAAIALGAAIPSFSSASAPPKLPDITLGQLIGQAESPHVGDWHGTIQWTAALGLPDSSELSSVGDSASAGFDWMSLTSGTHQVQVWAGAAGLRVALPGASNEVDLYSDASATWEYDSVTNTATRLVVTPAAAQPASVASEVPTPQTVGQAVLREADTWTDASFTPAVTIAGQPAYQVSLTPRPGAPGAASTTVGHVTLAVDAANGVVLRVAVYAVGATSPALEVGFRSVTFLAAGHNLPASDFRFSPGPGVAVTERHLRVGPGSSPSPRGSGDSPRVEGTGWDQVLVAQVPQLAAHHGGDLRRGRGVARELQAATTPVHGAWGSGRLLSTSLLNALILPNGEVIMGFVTGPALEAAAAGTL